MLNAYPHRTTRPESQEHLIRFEGAGSSAPVKHLGAGVTITREGTGAYRATWTDGPGVFLCVTFGLEADTPGDLAGHTVVADVYDVDNKRLDFVLYNASDAAHDLVADEYITVRAVFSTSAVGGA
jgi:hypothetical protein